MATHPENVGDLLRGWRQRRRFSQLALAGEAEVSTRHLSFVESGRASASREMLLRLAERLTMPLRERNRLLLAGGFAPVHSEQPLDATDMDSARGMIDALLAAHMPFPALVVDRHWNLITANAAVSRLLEGVDASLIEPPVNVLRLSLHPNGLAPRILNIEEWRHHLLTRLRHEADTSGDHALDALHAELKALPVRTTRPPPRATNAIAVPLMLADTRSGATLSFLSTTTVFGTATNVALAELTLECFYPADDITRTVMLDQAGGS